MVRDLRESRRLLSFRRLLPVVLIAVAVGIHVATLHLDRAAASPYPVRSAPAFHPTLVASGFAPPAEAPVHLPVPLELGRGGTLSAALSDLGVPPREVHSIGEAMAPWADPRRLRPGDEHRAYLGPRAAVERLEIVVDGKGQVELSRVGGEWTAAWREYERWSERRLARGTLEGSLEGSVQRAGGRPNLAQHMAQVLQWDVDFNRDLRTGDGFEILFEEVWVDGEWHGLGPIEALTFENGGRRIEAYRFGDEPGYYDAEGRPLQKMFLRSPIPYLRVTSGFSHRRFHPILKKYRPHYGVDYGAPTGTPVRVTAAGVVSFAGRSGGAGNMVKVRHPNGYLTAYLHLSRFARGVRAGRRVTQGEVIGYVGSTGLSTAPHLDYRVQRHGRWLNPLSLKSVPAEPIPEGERELFFAVRDRLRAELTAGPRPELETAEELEPRRGGGSAPEPAP